MKVTDEMIEAARNGLRDHFREPHTVWRDEFGERVCHNCGYLLETFEEQKSSIKESSLLEDRLEQHRLGIALEAALAVAPGREDARERLMKKTIILVDSIAASGNAGSYIRSLPKDAHSNWGWLQNQWPVAVAVDLVLSELHSMEAPPEQGDVRERLIEVLLSADLIAGYDWIGTGSRWPTQAEIREEVGEVADAILAEFTQLSRDIAGEIEADLEDGSNNIKHLYYVEGMKRAIEIARNGR